MTIVFESLEKLHPNGLMLEERVSECKRQGYEHTHKNQNTDIRKFIIYTWS